MTILDLGMLVRHYLKLVIALPIVCALLTALIFFLTPASFQAIATLVTNADINVAGGFAQNEASEYSQNGIIVSTVVDSATQSISVTAEGNDYGGCIAAANAAVLALRDDILALNAEYLVDVKEATFASNATHNPSMMIAIAFLTGLVVAVFIVAIFDMTRTPIKSREDIERISGLPVIGEIPARDGGERLLANVRFLADGLPSTIAVLPVGGSGASIACAELKNALSRSGIKSIRAKAGAHIQGFKSELPADVVSVVECPPLLEGMGAAYVAHEASFTILCATEWLDSRKVLANVVRELTLAGAKIGGVVFLVDRKPTEDYV